MTTDTHYRICPLCEATCGLELKAEGRNIVSIRGDRQDTFSQGFICPKGVALPDLDNDPDRLTTPMIRDESGWREATWAEAFETIESNWTRIFAEHGKEALGVYLGNPTVHNTPLSIYAVGFLQSMRGAKLFSASSVDQWPKQFASALMFGTGLSVPIPDVDRTDYLIIMGANPLVSNGSLLTAPNIGARLRGIQKRGGHIIAMDPRETKTTRVADEHLFIRPGTDAYFLFAVVNVLFTENLTSMNGLGEHVAGLDEVRELAELFPPESVAEKCGIPADTIRRIARELAAAKSAAVYARIGTCTQEFGTLASWLPDVIHVLTGNLDRPGGAMFPRGAHGPGNTKGKPGSGKGFRYGRHKSRVSQRPEIFGEYPVACLAEEIETPGKGQIRAMLTIAGNPVLSTPNGPRLAAAFDSVEFMVSIDMYLNETTRHANVILPATKVLERCHYDMAFAQFAVRNVARYSPAHFEVEEGFVPEWQIMLTLMGIVNGMGAKPDLAMLDGMMISTMIRREGAKETSPIHGKDAAGILSALSPRVGPERIIDFMLRTGPNGEGFGADPEGLTLSKLEENPHGIDLGPLMPRIPEVLRTATGKIELAPEPITKDIKRLQDRLGERDEMVLVGRRHLRTCNSWMHNIPAMVPDSNRCTLHIHPSDAERLGIKNDELSTVTSRVGSVTLGVEVTKGIMPGVVSIPHGWGHDAESIRMKVAEKHAGVNVNILTDEDAMDAPTGNSVLNGIPVSIVPAGAVAEAGAAAGAVEG